MPVGVLKVKLPNMRKDCPKCGEPLWIMFNVSNWESALVTNGDSECDAYVTCIEPCKKCGYKATKEELV